ncbi:hypothetical protein KBZ15_15440 [Cyanobium sp. BA20m-p-22]|uniref:hypothetical protein n=1 Tax=Cyanobium sp. BA20m-p-22 TaxID=2823704 RepID=UPI0020CED64C|nr:hypothetical protein [Cyanobium sp. BA20m-p-22]MCP9911287.1 hypothetical protein [Cyanobium sp. BA20m-p-22]
MDSFLGKLKSAADKAGSTAAIAQEKIIQEYLPSIVSALRDKAGPAFLEILSDVDQLAELARSAYQALPLPVRMVVKEQSFIDWVVSHQDSVVDNLKSQLDVESGAQGDPSSLPPGEVDAKDRNE